MSKRHIFILVFLTLSLIQLSAQLPELDVEEEVSDSLKSEVFNPDSAHVRLISIYDLSSKEDRSTFIVPEYFHKYNPADNSDTLYSNTGNIGSSSIPLYFLFDPKAEYNLGLNQYDLYKKSNKSFYDLSNPYSYLFFSPGQTQDHIKLDAAYAMAFNNGTGFSLDYSNIADNGWYESQLTRLSRLNSSVWMKPKDKKYFFLLNYSGHSQLEVHNGGVSNHSLYNEPGYQLRGEVPVYLRDASSRFQQREYSLNSFYVLSGEPDGEKFNMYLRHELIYRNFLFKYYDDNLSTSEIAFYGQRYEDELGIRHFIKQKLIGNEVELNTNWGKYLKLKTSLVHQFHLIDQEPNKINKNDAYVKAALQIVLWNTVNLESKAYIGLLEAGGEFMLQAQGDLDFNQYSRLKLKIISSRNRPSMLDENYYANQRSIWNNNLDFSTTNVLSAEYTIPFIGFQAAYTQTIGGNSIYYNNQNEVLQLDEIHALTQFQVKEKLKWRWLHFDNAAFFQFQSKDIYAIPEIYSVHSIYYQNPIFKKQMQFKGGFDFKSIQSFYPSAYDPITGTFYLQNDFKVDWYPSLDVFISGKVQNFAAFIKVENVLDPLIDDMYFLIKDHPQFDLKFRLGILWQLWN